MNKIMFIISSFTILLYSLTNCYFEIPKDAQPIPKEETTSLITYTTPENTLDITITNDTLYYLDVTNTLYALNLDTTTPTKIINIPLTFFCTINNHLICTGPEKTIVYNLNSEELFSSSPNTIIPYKDTFLILKDTQLYLPQKNQETEFQTLDINQDYNYEDYYQSATNTYLLFTSNNSSIIYNINDKTTTSIKSSNYQQFEYGFYFSHNQQLDIFNLSDDTTKTYSLTTNPNLSLSAIRNEELYFYHDNILTIHNLETNVTNTLEFPPIDFLTIKNDYLIATSKNKIYLLNLKNLKSSLNPNPITNNSATSPKDLIETKFPLHIFLKDQINQDFPDFTYEPEMSDNTINEALTKIEPILNKFDSNFYQSLKNDKFTGLNIYLTNKLTPKDITTQVANPAAYTLTLDGKFHIVIDISQPNIEEITCHELLHTLELNLKYQEKEPFSNWLNYNPPNFAYYNSYTQKRYSNYTLKEEEKENVYFIDSYSHTYPEEDRARLFENICTTTSTNLTEYPHLYAKALYLKSEITSFYPTLDVTSLFQNLNSPSS